MIPNYKMISNNGETPPVLEIPKIVSISLGWRLSIPLGMGLLRFGPGKSADVISQRLNLCMVPPLEMVISSLPGLFCRGFIVQRLAEPAGIQGSGKRRAGQRSLGNSLYRAPIPDLVGISQYLGPQAVSICGFPGSW